MEADIHIVKTDIDKVIAVYPVVLNGLNYEPSLDEFRELAWESACEDKIVNPNERQKYRLDVNIAKIIGLG